MSKQKFLLEAQKCEAADKKKQKLGAIHKKKKNADDGGGGVFIAVKKDFADSYRQTYLENDSETVWVKIDIKGRKPQFACCFYRSYHSMGLHVTDYQHSDWLKSEKPHGVV